MSGAAEELAKAGISVLHAHGPKNSLEVTQYSETAPYVAVPYLSRMDLAYAAADATICRSGAMTVGRGLGRSGFRPSTFRLPHGNGEQELNAKPVVVAGGAIIVSDNETHADVRRHGTVVPMLSDSARLDKMSSGAANVGHRTAATEIARIVLDIAAKENAVQENARGNR